MARCLLDLNAIGEGGSGAPSPSERLRLTLDACDVGFQGIVLYFTIQAVVNFTMAIWTDSADVPWVIEAAV